MGWLTGWGKRKGKIVAGTTAGVQTNYQLRLTVYKSSGTDSYADIYLGSSVRDDFGDVRFTSSDGVTEIDYYIESILSGVSAVIWVEIPSIPLGPVPTKIYLYYSNSSQTTTSNADNTFLFFDDFPGSSLDLTKWTIIGTNYTSVASSILTINTPACNINSSIKTINTFPTINTILDVYINPGAVGGAGGCKSWGLGNSTGPAWYTNADGWYARNTKWVLLENAVDNNIETNVDDSVWRTYSIKKLSASISYFKDGVEMTNSPLVPTFAGSSSVFVYNGLAVNIDWIRVRKYAFPEPSFGATLNESFTIIGNIGLAPIQRGMSFGTGTGATLGRDKRKSR